MSKDARQVNVMDDSGAVSASGRQGASRQEAEPRGRGLTRQTRAQDAVHPPVHGDDEDAPWAPPSNVDAPAPRPGYVQRWVRTAVRNEEDAQNLAKSFQMGWQPRRGDTIPKGYFYPTISEGQFSGCIGVHGMVLCEMTKTQQARMHAYFRKRTEDQVRAVRNDLQQASNPRMPLKHRMESEVVFERNLRRPRVQGDGDGGGEGTGDSD